MSRAERLLHLLECLRRYRHPVAGTTLAEELGISLRTLYRDIVTLQAQGARIEGEAGLGYVLRPGFVLPPLMFSEEEIEALVLGARWVAQHADKRLGSAARNVLAKISAVLPASLRDGLAASTLLVGPGSSGDTNDDTLALLRQALRTERKLSLVYGDGQAQDTQRVIWPVALAFFNKAHVLVAWCELRQAFRHFRTDRMTTLTMLETSLPRRRAVLLAEWCAHEGISPQDLYE